jgi:hypothetical protein
MNHNMKLESEMGHVTALLPDYVLEMLAGEEQRLVSSHLAVCRQCRLAARRERKIVHAVRDTFATATQPDSERLNALMPHVFQGRASLQSFWPQPLAATLLLLLVLLGSLALQSRRNEGIWAATRSGFGAATVAVTDTPTLTATSTATEIFPERLVLPTPRPVKAAVGTAVSAVSVPRPAIAPVAISPLIR